MKNDKRPGDRPTQIYPFDNRRNLMYTLCLAAIFTVFVTYGCDFREVDAAAKTNTRKDSHMESIQPATFKNQTNIPPIDAAVSTATKTATFAMG